MCGGPEVLALRPEEEDVRRWCRPGELNDEY